MHTHLTRLALLAILLASATAASADDFDLMWWTFDGGGEMWTNGGAFELSATIGQPDAGVMTGGAFELSGGFWPITYACPGDCNCDGQANFDDINAFVAALSGGVPCWFANVDCNRDGRVDFDDINPFVALLSGGGGPCP